jgi:hypothetical protein
MKKYTNKLNLYKKLYIKLTLFTLRYWWFTYLVSFIILTIFNTTTAYAFYDPETINDVEEKLQTVRSCHDEMEYDTYYDYQKRKLVYYPNDTARIYYPDGRVDLYSSKVPPILIESGYSSSSESSSESDSDSAATSRVFPNLPEDALILTEKLKVCATVKSILVGTETREATVMGLITVIRHQLPENIWSSSIEEFQDPNSAFQTYDNLVMRIYATCATKEEHRICAHYGAALAVYNNMQFTNNFNSIYGVHNFESFLKQDLQTETLTYIPHEGFK